jgi:hypothetical protein
MTTESLAFIVFAAVFVGGMAATTFGMLWIAVALYRQNRHKYAHPARVLRFARRRAHER